MARTTNNSQVKSVARPVPGSQTKARTIEVGTNSIQSISSQQWEEPKQAIESPAGRLTSIAQSPSVGVPVEPTHEYCLGSVAAGTAEIESQIEMLRSEIRHFEDRLRPFLPDWMYMDDGDACKDTDEGYYVAGNLNSPLLQALADLGNQMRYTRNALRRISANVVV